jgi:hypothetical protein
MYGKDGPDNPPPPWLAPGWRPCRSGFGGEDSKYLRRIHANLPVLPTACLHCTDWAIHAPASVQHVLWAVSESLPIDIIAAWSKGLFLGGRNACSRFQYSFWKSHCECGRQIGPAEDAAVIPSGPDCCLMYSGACQTARTAYRCVFARCNSFGQLVWVDLQSCLI